MHISGSVIFFDHTAVHIFENDGRIIIQVPHALIDFVDVVCLDCGLPSVVGPDMRIPIKKALTTAIQQAKENI